MIDIHTARIRIPSAEIAAADLSCKRFIGPSSLRAA